MAVRSVWILSTVFATGLLCFAQTSAKNCVLAGTVLNSATNAGIPHALVSFRGVELGFRFTDTGGNFQVQNVPCELYSLSVSKPGFVSGQEDVAEATLLFNPTARDMMENQSDQPGVPPQPAITSLKLTPDSQPARIPLVPVASISGAVLDENGEPIAGVVVQSFMVKASLSGPDYVSAKTAHTDDRGRYALLDLAPNDYVVRLAGEASSTHYYSGAKPNTNGDHRGMQPVYYSNADTLASAMVLHLAPAAQINVDFRQATEAAFDVNGKLTGFAPQAWTRLRLYRDGDRMPVGRAFVNITSGQFRLTDIPHGSYTLRVEQYQADPPLWFAAEEPLSVAAEPIRDLVVQLSRAVDIPVSVSYEEGAKDEGSLNIRLQPQHSRENARELSIGKGMQEFEKLRRQANKDITASPQPNAFTNVIPDKYKVTVQANLNGNGYVASAKLGDVDVLHGEFPIGGSIGGPLQVTVRGDSATVQGQVTFQGQAALGARIYLIPTGEGVGLQLRFGDPEGHYEIAGVAPGDYRIRAWMGDPSMKEILAGGGEMITLEPSERRTVTIEATPLDQK